MRLFLYFKENLLLDEEQNLKLIDFGLCAKPEGGIKKYLETCCGSPAYAAPELISGQEYLGGEFPSKWSVRERNLTEHKSQYYSDGKYDEPSWLSGGSISLLQSMLQVNPRRRISIWALLSHPWVTANDHTTTNEVDTECAAELAVNYGKSTRNMSREILQWKYDYCTATYFLLQKKKNKGLPVRFSSLTTKTYDRAWFCRPGGGLSTD
ncbi:Maternal embryonic leucine zipper kinase [Nymphon striatum]|nr:Maternal embryonic leucine zipper kinase [Nymphon striatum]